MSAINWMVNKAERSALEDGTIEYFFNGNLPSRMVREVKKYAAAQGAVSRDSNRESTLSWSNSVEGFSFTTGSFNSTQNRIRFAYRNYIAPAAAAGDAEAAWLEFMAS